MTDGLRYAHREAIIAALAANDRVERAVLFGSRATGTNTVTSDVDIALFGDRLTLTDQARLAAAADEIPMAQSVDLILYDSVRDRTLREHIRNDGVEWFTREHAVMGATGGADIRRAALGDIIDLTLSSVDKKSKPRERPVRLCNYMDVYNNTFITDQLDFMAATATDREVARCGLVRGDVIITKDSEKHDDIGVPALVRHDIANLVCGYHLAILRPRPGQVTGAYLVYALKAPPVQHQFHAYANGVTRFGLRKGDIGLVEVPLPSLPEQRAIAHVLGTLDDKIELNRRMNETLEAMTRALFKSWFVDFDPVRAKMEGRDTGLPREISDLFPDRMVDSELGGIPDGWKVVLLGDLVELAYGKPLPKRQRRPGRVPVFGSNGQVGWHDQQLVDGPGVVVGRKGNPGLVRWSPTGFFPIDTTFYVVPKDARRGMLFLFHLLRTQDLPSIASDSAVPGMNRNLAYMNRAIAPSKDVVGAFTKAVEAISTRQYGVKQESRALAALRDTLLPKLISGEIRVPATDRGPTQ
ncbi:MAG: restriction endonuclease subunit S [Gemmatimonadota bacterium]|nr:restriction endonuclease subunit S [Gemmatimonadota bacterium]